MKMFDFFEKVWKNGKIMKSFKKSGKSLEKSGKSFEKKLKCLIFLFVLEKSGKVLKNQEKSGKSLENLEKVWKNQEKVWRSTALDLLRWRARCSRKLQSHRHTRAPPCMIAGVG